jgi:hypothetical protein
MSSAANEIRPAVNYIFRSAHLVDVPNYVRYAYSKYLFSSLESDFNDNRFGAFDAVLEAINRIENGDIDNFIFDGQGFTHEIFRNHVLFEHSIFSICPHWPLWSCSLFHYKIAVQGWMKFLQTPESLDTELIMELPESDMAKIAIFPPRLFENEKAFDANHD